MLERTQDGKTRSNFQLCSGGQSTGVEAVAEKWAELNITCENCRGPGKVHGTPEKAVVAHTRPALNTRSRGIECHLAKTGSNAVRGEARNHTFDFISPAAPIQNGDPDSCNTCHADKTPQWVLDAVMKWWPKKSAPLRHREDFRQERE